MKLNKKPLMFAAAVMGAAASSLSFAPNASAAAIPVQNFSFEGTGTGSTAYFTTAGGASGTQSGPVSGAYTQKGGPAAAEDGTYYANLFTDAAMGAPTLTQAGVTTLIAGDMYTLTVGIGQSTSYVAANGFGGVAPTSNISLIDGTTLAVLATSTGLNGSGTGFTDYSISFTATAGMAGDALNIQLGNDLGSTQYSASYFDDVRLDGTAAVPEPSTIALMLGGLGALALVRRMRRTA